MGAEAVKLLERMKASKSGWKRDHLDRLYEGFGFIIKHGHGKNPHDKVYHPDHPELFTFVPRHTKVGEVYIDKAVKLVTRFQEMESKHGPKDIERKSD
ncbi:MAG TPA: hypothetical protein VF918_11735 [Anaerolineales bacterium]